MQNLTRNTTKSIEEYRHNIKLLKYNLKKQQKINETLRYKQAKKTKKGQTSKISQIKHHNPVYSLVILIQQLNIRTRQMGITLGDVFRMSDYQYQGQITKQQFMKTILRLKVSLQENMINQMFYAIDTDLNGYLSQDQYSEFLYAHGGCDNKEAIAFQNKSAQHLASSLKKSKIKVSDLLNKCRDPIPAEDMASLLKQQQLNKNQITILLKMWDPSLSGSIKHEVYLKSMENVKLKDQKEIKNQQFQKGIQDLLVILRDRKINPITIFQESEADGEQGISQFELQEGLKKLLPEETPFQIRKWVQLINFNKDKEITKEQFISTLKSFYSIQQINKFSNQYDQMHPKLKKALKGQEIPAQKIIQQLGNYIEDQGLTKAELFQRIDINQNGLVDKQELLEGLKNIGLRIEIIGKVLTVFDRDASGQISLDEWLNILGEDVQFEDIEQTSKITKPVSKQIDKSRQDKKTYKQDKKQKQSKQVVKKTEDITKGNKNKKEKQKINQTTQIKHKSPLKTKDKNKTLKQTQGKTQTKIIKTNKVHYAQDSMIESRKDLQKPPSDPEQQFEVEQLEKQIARMYCKSKKQVLFCFQSVCKGRKGINQQQLRRSISGIKLQVSYSDGQINMIYKQNTVGNKKFQYQQWLKSISQKYIPQDDTKVDCQVKKQPQKRGAQHEQFQGLFNVIIQNQTIKEKGYIFSEFVASQQALSKLNTFYLPKAEQIKNSQKVFKDKQFKPQLTSLTKNTAQSKIKNVSLLKWKHYKQLFTRPQLFQKGVLPNDINQGELGDCYFLCSLSSLAQYEKLIERLFEYVDLQLGYFLIWICVDGIWQIIELDGFIPVDPKGEYIYFSKCKQGQEQLWVILLEKAYAKAYGCYQFIEGGQPHEAIKDLTGAPGQSISHKSDQVVYQNLWRKLLKADQDKFIMTCGTDNSGQGDSKLDGHSESITSEGIVKGHAYSILDVKQYKGEKLIQLRNPWGGIEWKGDWSDESKKWTPQAKKALKYEQSSQDGIFWMQFSDYFKFYNTTAINYIRPNYFYTSKEQKSVKNLVIKVSASSLKHGFIMVAQEDHRKKGLPHNTPYNVCHLIVINYKDQKVISKLQDQKYMYQREGSVELDSSKAQQQSDFIVIINLQKTTDINLCTYSNQIFQLEIDDSIDVMLKYIQAIAQVQQSQDPKKVQIDSSHSFKSWLTSVGQYGFLVFKNISSKSLKIKVNLKQPNNIQLRGELSSQLRINVGDCQSIQGKIIDAKKPFSFGPMSYELF